MKRSLPILAWVLFVMGGGGVSQQLHFGVVTRGAVEKRLQGYKGNDSQREAVLKEFFQASGCVSPQLSEQRVKHLKEPNLICALPGSTSSAIVVGAHYDHVESGKGVVDNWSGASLLPSLFEAVKTQPRQHTFVFIAFSGEEQGLVGSEFYVKNLASQEKSKIEAMVNMDTLGLGPTEVWVSHSDPNLVLKLSSVAHAMNLPLSRMDVEQVGKSDEEPFNRQKIPNITIHTLTQATLPVLHSSKDEFSAIKLDDYYNTFRLLAAYLVYLDEQRQPSKP